MLKKLAVPALFTVGLLSALGPAALAKNHGRGGNRHSDQQQGDWQEEHDSRDFGHSRGGGRGQNWGYEQHDRRDFGLTRSWPGLRAGPQSAEPSAKLL